jgi:hypothetical protein
MFKGSSKLKDSIMMDQASVHLLTIRMALTLMLASGGTAHVVGVKGAFLCGKFDDGEKIYIKVSLTMIQFYCLKNAFMD